MFGLVNNIVKLSLSTLTTIGENQSKSINPIFILKKRFSAKAYIVKNYQIFWLFHNKPFHLLFTIQKANFLAKHRVFILYIAISEIFLS